MARSNSRSNGRSNGKAASSGAVKAGVPDGGWGWVVVGGSTLIHFLVVGMGRSFGVFYLDLLDRFRMSSSATSWVVAIYNTMRMAFGPLAGMLCDRFTCKRVVLCGGLVASIGCVITAFATSLTYTYFSFGLVTGIGASFLFTPSYVIVGKYFDKNKGKAMSISTMGAGLGTVGLAPLIQLLLDTYSFFGAMLILGALMLHNCLAGLLFRPLPEPHKEQEMQDLSPTSNGGGEVGENPPGETPPVRPTFSGTLRRQLAVLANFTFLMYGLQILCMSICLQVFLSFLPAIAEQYGADRRPAALLLSVMGLADMAGRFLWGFFFDLKTIRHRRRFFHTLLGFPLSALVFVTGFMGSYWAFFAMTIAFGLVEGGFHSQRATIVSEFVAKDQLSSTVGFVIFFQGLGNMAGPPVAGMLRDTYHTYNVCYFFGGAALFISSILFLAEYFIQKMLARRRKPSQPLSQVEA